MVVKSILIDILADTLSTTSLCLPSLKENQLNLHFETANEIITHYSEKEPILPFAASDVFQSRLKDYRRLSAVDVRCKAVYEVALDVTGSNFRFRPGDTIGIVPRNVDKEVDAIVEHLELTSQQDLQYTVLVNNNPKAVKIPPHIPTKSSVRHVLTYCCDIRCVLKKLFLLALSRYTKDKTEQKILEYLCSKEGTAAYNTHILNKYFCILDLFATFKSCRPPIEVLLTHLPRLLPRPYSIVNSSLLSSNTIKICFSVSEVANNRKGIVTGWLERIINNEISIEDKFESLNINNEQSTIHVKVPIYTRKNMSEFTPPEDLEIPLILIGPGTGVSPYIGFLEERQLLMHEQPDKTFGEVWLFFGCRNPKLDFIYEKELNMFLEDGVVKKLITSFSRFQNYSGNKYIQDGLIKNGVDLVKLINNGAAIFVCGDNKNMASQVKETLAKCIAEHSNKTLQDAEKILSDMQRDQRYLVDAWS